MKSDIDFKLGLLRGLKLAIDMLDDEMRDYDDGASERLALHVVRSDLDLLRKEARDSKSSFVRQYFQF